MTKTYAAAAPTFTVDGTLRRDLARDVSFLRVDEATDGMKTLELCLVAHGPRSGARVENHLYLDGEVVDFGHTITVSLGAADAARIVFSGAISALESRAAAGVVPFVTVFAEDELMALRMTRRMKTHENVTDADLARAIAREHKLTPDANAPGPTYKVVQQWNQSDLAFLRERARLVQAELWFTEGTLHFATRGYRNGTTLTLTLGKDLLEAQLRADLAHQRTSVKVSGYDAARREAISEEATADVLQAELTGGRTGVAILKQAFGDRASFRVRNAPLLAGEARAWAQAEMLRRGRAFVTVSGMTNGTPDMVVGSQVSLDHVGTPFNGDGYYVTRVTHTYDIVDGFRTHFDAERATVTEGAS